LCGGCGGCKGKKAPIPEVYVNRANDDAYINQLLEMRKRQIEVAEVQVAIARQMTQHVERVRATFPQGVGDDTLAAALAEDSTWKGLEARAKAQAELANQIWEEDRDAIRDRMLEQGQAEREVQRGRARAIDKPDGPDVAKAADKPHDPNVVYGRKKE